MNVKDRDKLLLRIGDARLSINLKGNLTPMDRKIDSVLKDCATYITESMSHNKRERRKGE